MKPTSSRISRRHFLATTAAAVAAPTFIPAKALGRAGAVAPSERIVMGIVGWGMMGPGNTTGLMGNKDCQIVAACDLDSRPLAKAVETINKHYQNTDCKSYHDYHEMFARTDIDAVMLAVPDHWHAAIATDAANAKKDIYGEKPLARTIGEQQAIVKAVQKNVRIWQTGSWQRSVGNFHKAAEIVRNGLIGKVTEVQVGLPGGHNDFKKTAPALLTKLGQPADNFKYLATLTPASPDWKTAVTEPPPELDYERWTGPSEMLPYIEARHHMNWRWNYNYGAGQLIDWMGHHGDIAHWGLDFDRTGPLEIEGTGEFPPKDAVWNTCTKYRCTLKYPNGVTMTVAGGHPDIRSGTKWIGSEGWVWVDRGGFDASNPEWKTWKDEVPEKLAKVRLHAWAEERVQKAHYRNFLDSVKSRKPSLTPAETAHNSLIPGHLSLIAMLVGRKIKWDAKKEKIVGDDEASKLLTRHYRSPWKLG
jgi:predicted dehydrogenase